MKNSLLFIFLMAFLSLNAQDLITKSQLLIDQEYQLKDKDKRTHSTHFEIPIPQDLLNQFERIDAVFISSWIGHGAEGLAQYRQDAEQGALNGEEAVMVYANGKPGLFHYPKKQTGFGMELMLTTSPDTLKSIKRYRKKKIRPRGVWRAVLFRDYSTTPVFFNYRYPLKRKIYEEEATKLYAYLRTSSKADTVNLNVKIVLTIKGIKKAGDLSKIPAAVFLKEAVVAGLKADAFPKEQAKEILRQRNNFFVTKCPICRPVEAAIEDYLKLELPQKESQTPKGILLGLLKDNKEEQQIAFSQLINRYVEAYYEELGMNAEEKMRMQKELEADRKQGMGLKPGSFGDFCPSCDGACKIKH